MMDDIDFSQQEQSKRLDAYIQTQLENGKLGTGLVSEGHCHHCYEDIEVPKLFCDGHCADRYERFRKR